MLYLACIGEGSPTVVLEAGGTGNSVSWNPVQSDIAKFTRVCSYDRASAGNSSPFAAHRSIEAMVSELHALLEFGRVDKPVVIVGQSFGGRLPRAFGSLYADDVVRMVLVDPGHEGFLVRAEASLAPDEWAQYVKAAGGIVSRMEEIEGTMVFEPPGEFPLTVLSAAESIDRPEVYEDVDKKFHQFLTTLHRELAASSPNGTHLVADKSGHGIQFDQPALIVGAIRQVVDDIRNFVSLIVDHHFVPYSRCQAIS